MSKDDMETQCMNEMFGVNKMIKAEIYTVPDKPENESYTSLIVAKCGTVYFKDVLNTPELTAIQRGVSFVKHNLDVDATEIYSKKITAEDIEKDAYIRWCKVNAIKGVSPDDYMQKLCETELKIYNRWNLNGGRE